MALSCYQWVVFLQRNQYCYVSQRLTSRTDYFINAWLKTRQIIIYPLISVRCKVQDEDYDIHDASQRKISPQYSIFLASAFPRLLINNWFIRQRLFIEIWSTREVWRARKMRKSCSRRAHRWRMNQLFYNIFNPMENFSSLGICLLTCTIVRRAQ